MIYFPWVLAEDIEERVRPDQTPEDALNADRIGSTVAVRLAVFALAWLPFFVIWTLVILGYTDGNLRGAIISGFANTVVAAGLGVGIWLWSARIAWPDRVSPVFYLTHLLSGSMFAVVWIVGALLLGALVYRVPIGQLVFNQEIFIWRFLLGLWIYGGIIGIAYAFRHRAQIADQERRVLRAEKLSAEAKLQALRGRLEPHFLFNTLHSVSALIHKDVDRAEEAIERLGDLLRRLLAGTHQHMATLEEEWSFAVGYLALEQLRLPHPIDVQTDVPAEAWDADVPFLLLQPLVENAIQRGGVGQAPGGCLCLVVRIDGPNLRISLSDNGVGHGSGVSTRGHGVGLSVLDERLEHLYSGKASARNSMPEGGGYCVDLTLPYEGTPE